MMAEGLYLLPGEEEQHERVREAWIKAERAALDAERQRSKNGAEIVHNLICECGREHLIRLTVTGRHITQHVDCAQGSVRADPVNSADRDLKRDGQHLLPSFEPKNSVLKVVHDVLRRLVGAFDGKARAGADQEVNLTPRPDASQPPRSPKKKKEAA